MVALTEHLSSFISVVFARLSLLLIVDCGRKLFAFRGLLPRRCSSSCDFQPIFPRPRRPPPEELTNEQNAKTTTLRALMGGQQEKQALLLCCLLSSWPGAAGGCVPQPVEKWWRGGGGKSVTFLARRNILSLLCSSESCSFELDWSYCTVP